MNRQTAILCAFVAVAAFAAARLTDSTSTVEAQSGGNPILSSCATQNSAHLFVYMPSTQQIVAYERKTNSFELKAIRTIASDFNSKIIEYPTSRSKTSPKSMKKLADDIAKANAKKK